MNLRQRFTEEDLGRIRAAVKEAENKISGEIVPFFVERSGVYTIAHYKASLIAGTFFFVAMIFLDRYWIEDATHTLYYDPLFIFFVVIAGAGLGALLSYFFDPVRRWLIPRDYQDACCRQAAENAFLEEEVFSTRQRTGILIFVSFFEHEVVVMADKGISSVVDQHEWDEVVNILISRIRQGKLVEGIVEGIKKCGEILFEKGFVKTPDDVNELGDDLRIN